MGHDQCVAPTLREHNDLKDSAKAYTQQIKIIAKDQQVGPDLKDSAKAYTQQIKIIAKDQQIGPMQGATIGALV